MSYLFGLIISAAALFLSAYFLDQKASYFYDPVALVMVIGGTIAVTVATKPNLKNKNIFKIIANGLDIKHRRNQTAKFCSSFLKGEKLNLTQDDKIEMKILNSGYELIQLGLPKQEIEAILNLKMQIHTESTMVVSNWIRTLAKYPPAFGLAGTVLGLIHLMKSLTEGSSPSQVGILMALALLATLYGIIVSNFVIAPLGEKIKGALDEELINAEMAIHTIMLKAGNTNLLIAQENLGQYLIDEKQKIDLITSNDNEALSA